MPVEEGRKETNINEQAIKPRHKKNLLNLPVDILRQIVDQVRQ